MKFDTIAAISTAIGEGAIGIIRISGDKAIDISQEIFKPKNKNIKKLEDKKLVYGHIVDENNIVDEVLITTMYAPNTYTKEDIVEINCHGGSIPLQKILKLILKKGARLAEPGEFTKRAFLNGRLDLTQAESIMDLISAKTSKGFDIALEQLSGSLSKEITELRQNIEELLAFLAVSIDYPEEDIEEITFKEIENRINDIISKLDKLIISGEKGKIYREGILVSITGKPNVGKSSLMNALLNESRAIVTDIPGTTRDIIEEYINVEGIPLKIVDTAGIRETEDIVEKIGVERSKEIFNKSDLVIFILNASEKLSKEDREIMELIVDKKAIVIINKTDLENVIEEDEINKILHKKTIIKTSITNNKGLDVLEKEIYKMIMGDFKESNSKMVTNTRHIAALEKAYTSFRDALIGVKNEMPYDFLEVDIKNGYEYLGEITGDTVEADIVTKIFKNFCLGK